MAEQKVGFSSKIQVIKVQRIRPHDEEEWLERIARVLLQDQEKPRKNKGHEERKIETGYGHNRAYIETKEIINGQ